MMRYEATCMGDKYYDSLCMSNALRSCNIVKIQSRPQNSSLDLERDELWGTLKQNVFSLVSVKNNKKSL